MVITLEEYESNMQYIREVLRKADEGVVSKEEYLSMMPFQIEGETK